MVFTIKHAVEKTRYSRINNFCLIFLTGFAMTAALIFTKTALVPLVFSFFLYGVVTSLVRGLTRRFKVGKTVATFAVLVGMGAFIYEVIAILLFSTNEILYNMIQYKEEVIYLVQTFIDRFPVHVDGLTSDSFIGYIQHFPYLSYAKSITSIALKMIGNLFLIITFLIFFLMGERKSELENPLLRNILEKVTAYVSIKFLTSLLNGVLVGLLLYIFHIQMFLIFGFVTFILNFIPNVGATFATLLPLPLILFRYGFGWEFIFLLATMTAIHAIIGYFLDPKIMGESLDLHPVAILVFLIFWGLVWGIPGLFLAVPITSILKITLSRLDSTRAISEILSGRLPQ